MSSSTEETVEYYNELFLQKLNSFRGSRDSSSTCRPLLEDIRSLRPRWRAARRSVDIMLLWTLSALVSAEWRTRGPCWVIGHLGMNPGTGIVVTRQDQWLLVNHRIIYKLCLITWKTLHTTQPSYLSELITMHCITFRSSHFSNTNIILAGPYGITSSFLSRVFFPVSAPSTWNSARTR